MDVLSIKFLSAAFMFFTAGLSLLFAIGQLCGRKRYFENYVLFSYLVCLSLILFQVCMIVNNINFTNPRLLFFHMTALYFMAPVIYCADYLVILSVEAMPRSMGFLFLPVAVGLAADVFYIAMPDADKLALMADLFRGTPSPWGMPARAVFAGAGALMLVYMGFLLKKLLPGRGESPTAVFYVMILSMFVVAGVSVVTIAGYLTGSHTLLRWGANLVGLLVIGAYVASQRHPKILQLLMFEAEKKYYERSLLGQVDVSGMIKRLNRIMEEERLYTDDQLTLRDLADELSITPHQLSQLLNERLDTNFSNFVNQFRIRDARDMLVNQPEKTVLAISLEVGFNSKSAFYEAFSRFSGMSPQAFRKNKGGQNDPLKK
ncbi:MAG TPA: helix-turn-helix domain-containing protein [Spirochaetota bacterium]|nr:AraC family transcriptional regulator [Spirochaetota bacterium]HOD16393.1 helix-turn-helix domain-containing protein [Spirochaetota bacterium]HPG49974.1 helix-turn-helix domain-containing protein [Spirochaetota bacterium]HPN12849.1 helix-turn-helix domain-containing protein [Spirochaetota bacterium]